MTTHSSDTRELREDEDEDEESPTGAKRAAATIASVNENGLLSLLLGGALLAGGARSYAGSGGRGRAIAQGLAGAALVAFGLRQRRSDAGTEDDDTSAEAAAHREQAKVIEGDETNPRGTSGEPEVERQTDAGNVEFTEDQDLESERQPDLDEESTDPRTGGDPEVDLSEAAMADEASEATGPSSTQSQPAQTDRTEPESDPDEDDSSMSDDTTANEDEPDPDADPGEATEEATSAESEDVAEEVIEGEIDDEDREGVETEGGATVHTDTNESDNMDIDVDDVTDPDDDLNTESADSDEQSSSHLDEDPPDEDE